MPCLAPLMPALGVARAAIIVRHYQQLKCRALYLPGRGSFAHLPFRCDQLCHTTAVLTRAELCAGGLARSEIPRCW